MTEKTKTPPKATAAPAAAAAPPAQALAPRPPEPTAALATASRPPDVLAPFDARRFAGAGTLVLSAEEVAILTAPLGPDEIRHDNPKDERCRRDKTTGELILYLCHDLARARLMKAFGPGQWALVPVDDPKAKSDGRSVTVLQTWDLFIRGVFVGRATGDGTYWTSNAQMNERDAIEACQSVALRTICQKALGMGLELFDRDRRRELLDLKARGDVLTPDQVRDLCIAQRAAGITDDEIHAWLVEQLGPWCTSRKLIPKSEADRVRRWIASRTKCGETPHPAKASRSPQDARSSSGGSEGRTQPKKSQGGGSASQPQPSPDADQSMRAACRRIYDACRAAKMTDAAILAWVREGVGVELPNVGSLLSLTPDQLVELDGRAQLLELPF
jgi:hypothetical protein